MLPRSQTLLLVTAMILLALGVACLTVMGTAPYWGPNVSGEQPALGEEVTRGERLEAERTALLARIEEKLRLGTEVVARRLTLAEAAARLAVLSREAPVHPMVPGPMDPDASEDERLCREVLGYVEDALAGRPHQTEAVRARLEEELREHLARRGLTPAGGPAEGRK
jgi:hypothetical protein